MQRTLFAIAFCCIFCGLVERHARADDEGNVPSPFKPQPARSLEAAVSDGLQIVQRAAANYPSHRQCFSCHHQTLPLLAMAAVRDAERPIDAELFESQWRFTDQAFRKRLDTLQQAGNIGGKALTVGYGLWAWEITAAQPDELSAAMVHWLVEKQEADGAWKLPSYRPPMSESPVMSTVLAMYGLQKFASDETAETAPATEAAMKATEAAMKKAQKWLAEAEDKYQEDRVARLWAASFLAAESESVETARQAVLAQQQSDGGWPPEPGMASDAYATGQTLFVLAESGFSPSEKAYQRGVRFLLDTQCEDGSWFVATRTRPVQVFFDNGDPHGKSQFISVAATSWAVAASARALRKDVPAKAASDAQEGSVPKAPPE